MNPFDNQKPIPGVKSVIAVGSGKGGVGKSTMCVNLAMSLVKYGKVGILDADIYGPSIPRMIGAVDTQIEVKNGKLVPLERFGMKIISFGFLIKESEPVIWRGPMLFKVMDQFLFSTDWGELDYLLVDLPPGTGDVVLSLCQKTQITTAIIVSTPQNLSLSDASKSIAMFEKLGIKVFGLIENMSAYNSGGGKMLSTFPKGNMDSYLKKHGIDKLASVVFDPDIAMSAEIGMPLVKTKYRKNLCDGLDKISKNIYQIID